MEARRSGFIKAPTKFLTSTGIIYGHIIQNEFPKNLKKYIIFIILILQDRGSAE